MVYYNPYKNIFRALMRAIRVFIGSLFSKRLLLMIIVALVIMLLHLNVNATTYAEGWTYRQTTSPVYNEETDKYDIDYRIYNQNGVHEGTISIPSSIYNGNNFFLMMNNSNQFILYQYTYKNTDKYYFYYENNYYKLTYDINTISKNFPADRSRIYIYNESTDNWDTVSRSNNNYWISNKNEINPNSIIYANCYVHYYLNNSADITHDLLLNYKVFRNPQIQLLQNEGFRIYLNDFINYSNNESEYETINQNLQSIICNVYDKNNNSYVTYNSNVLNVTGIQEDEENGYYIDITFDEFFTYMNKFDSDYIITFTPKLDTLIHRTSYGSSTLFDFSTIFTCNVNVRYIYYANLGAGVIRIVDDDGNLIEGQKPFPTEEELRQEIEKEEAEKKEQEKEQARLDAIQGVTNSIDNMSDFLQDDNFSSDSITDNMPSSDEFQDVTENGFDNIFTTLRNTFTSDNYQDVVFEVPFSNGQTITLPSNLTENIIPTAIKTLIQMVYWYFIARFIVKDIAGYIEKAKSGDIFNSSDTNIKTDML